MIRAKLNTIRCPKNNKEILVVNGTSDNKRFF